MSVDQSTNIELGSLSDVREEAVYNCVGGEGADDGGGREGGGGGEASALKWQQKQASYVML